MNEIEVYLVNAQGLLGAYKLWFEGPGLYRFVGDNSNGKSIFIKFLTRSIKGSFKNPEKRRTIINRHTLYADMVLLKPKTGEKIHVHVTKDASSTFCTYTPREGEQGIKRYVADGEWISFFRRFGFNYNEKRGISLNIYNTYDPLLFINESDVVNFDMIRPYVSDVESETALENMIEMDEYIRNTLKQFNQELVNLEAQENNLEFYDSETCENDLKNLVACKENILALNIPEFKECSPIPDTSMIEALDITRLETTLGNVNFPSKELIDSCNVLEGFVNFPTFKRLDNEVELIDSYNTAIEESRCPTCGRKWIENDN